MPKIRTALVVLLMAAACNREPPAPVEHDFGAVKMGSDVQIRMYTTSFPAADSAARAAFARIEQIDSLLSDYRSTSEVAQLAAQKPDTTVAVSPDLMKLVQASLPISRATGGAFDVTAGSLTQLWRAARRRDTIPTRARVCEALRSVGWEHVTADSSARTLRLGRSGMRFDFGGIGKGYAADEAMGVLRQHGVTSAVIIFGAEVVASDPPPGSSGWPVRAGGDSLTVANAALSTSGDEWQFIELGGVRYSHVIDPRTGWALTNRVTATVRAPTGMIADAAATAVTVLDSTAATAFIAALPGAELLRRTTSGSATSAGQHAACAR